MKPIIIANWKMNLSFTQACKYFQILSKFDLNSIFNLIFAVPSLYLSGLKLNFNDYNFAAQNISHTQENYGAYTGEISANMLNELGINYAIIGHSERRSLFQENIEMITLKIQNCINNNIIPIICIGENKEIRDNLSYRDYIDQQMEKLSEFFCKKIIIAYEPIWAIGTNIIPNENEIGEIVRLIKKRIKSQFSDIENNVNIVYGGSVSVDNIGQISKSGVNGVLIGKSALEPENLAQIINKY